MPAEVVDVGRVLRCNDKLLMNDKNAWYIQAFFFCKQKSLV